MEQENEQRTGAEESNEAVGGRGVGELEVLLAARDEELRVANTRLQELEQAQAVAGERLGAVTGSLEKVVAGYRALVLRTNPEVPEELVKGDSIEAIDLSLQSAKELIGRVKDSIEAEKSATRVPAGAPPRSSASVSVLSPIEKIREGMGRVKS